MNSTSQIATLQFDLEDPYAKEEYLKCIHADRMVQLLEYVQEDIFRPARKHGYSNRHKSELNRLIEIPEVARAIELLEDLYYDAKKDTLTVDLF
jgi:hypothetical protein